MTKNYFKDIKGLVKEIELSIYWIHIMCEGHIYLFNLLKLFVSQYLQKRIPKDRKCFKKYWPQG
jgi:hypothetical protein